ncbi:hypothetical protein EDB84DRAFT_1469042 [Lactarius hengduanensis]|nr:hypothetical protein EDB84DRAFT_1469042 [Lactarius hengduanensis]
MSGHHKVPFTDDDDTLLMKFIATYKPQPKGRLGMKLYERLVENAEGKWSFASRHPVNSWRERYKMNQPWFDAKILQYQKKHGISADGLSPVAGQSSASKKPAFGSQTNPSSPLAGGSGSKKRAREINATDSNLDSSPTKKMRRASPSPHPVLPLVKPQSKGKLRAALSPSPPYEEDRDLTMVGPDDYIGALSGESDQGGEESQSDGGQGNESSSPFPPSSPTKKTRSKPSANTKSMSHGRVGVSTVPEKSSQPLASSSHQQHSPEHSPTAARPSASASKTLSPVHKLVIPPPQLSQEPTPPHTSALSSPSPPPRGNSHTPGTPPQSGTVRQPPLVAPPKQRRPRPIKRRIVHEEEDDIFCTPPVQSLPSSSPPQTRARDAPRLLEGPYRSAYTRANGGQRASGVRKEEEANGNEWPPRKSKQDVPISSPERPTAADVDRASVQHIDLRVLHSRKSVETFRAGSSPSLVGSTSRTVQKKRPRQARASRPPTPPNLSESNKELVLALGLEEVYKRMADNHKFHVDIVREVAARQRSLEHADQVLRNMREAAEQEYARLLKQEFRTEAYRTEESDEAEEEEGEDAENLRNEEPEQDRSALSQPASPCSNHSLPDLSMADRGGYMEVDADDTQELDNVPTTQADSSLPGSPALPNVEWTDDDDELLLDGDLVVHEELVKRKGLGSVKFRTAHLYSLLLDG